MAACLLLRCPSRSPRGMYHCRLWLGDHKWHEARCSRESDYQLFKWTDAGDVETE